MCGRYKRTDKFAQIAHDLTLTTPSHWTPRYNIAPSQLVACIRTNPDTQQLECCDLKWGLVPSWAKDPSIGHKLINARGETVAEKPSFRHAFKQQRCLVLADGYYEWKREGKTKQPYYIHLKDHRPFAFAGLWERWEKEDQVIESCSLITIHANSLMEPIHHRMPVILPTSTYGEWLDPHPHNPTALLSLLQPYEAEGMEAYPVSLMVNNPRNDHPQCLHPL